MALDQLLNWIVDALFNPLAVGDDRLRAPVADGIGGDDPLGGDDEHRLVVAVAEDVDVVRAVDLGGCERRSRRRRLRPGRGSGRGEPAAKSCNKCAFHVSSFLIGRCPAETGRGPGLFPGTEPPSQCYLECPALSPTIAANVPARLPGSRSPRNASRSETRRGAAPAPGARASLRAPAHAEGALAAARLQQLCSDARHGRVAPRESAP